MRILSVLLEITPDLATRAIGPPLTTRATGIPLWYLFDPTPSVDLDGENRERAHMRLFQFSISGQASNWLERLATGSITTWKDLTTRFLAQFFPPGRTAKLCNDILMFQQHHGESLSEAWTRFKTYYKKSLIMALTFGSNGPHATQYCMEDPEQAFVEYTSSRTNEAGEPMPTITYYIHPLVSYPNSCLRSPSTSRQDDTFMPNPSASPSFTQDDTFMPEPIQPMPTFTQTAFSQPAVHTQHTHPAQTNPTSQQYPNNVQSQQFQHKGTPQEVGKDAKGKQVVHPHSFSLMNMLPVTKENKASLSGNEEIEEDEEDYALNSTRPDKDDINLKSLELDVRIGHSYGVKGTAVTHSFCFIGTKACSGSKPTYSLISQRIVPSVSQDFLSF
ncbi:zinc finger, CCHC-type containing protein [Tanacetum coccineum]